MKNGECVNILRVETDQMTTVVPPDIIQDGEAANLGQFDVKIYYKRSDSVFVDYFLNSNGEKARARLNNLKAVGLMNS